MHHDYGVYFRRSAITAVLLAMAAGAASAPRAVWGAELEQISLTADQRAAVLTLTLSAPVVQHVFRLQHPERLVIDLPATVRRAPLPQPPAGGVIAALRSGARDGQALRLVMELRAPLQPQLQSMTRADGYQLRIALAATADGEPQAPAVEPTTAPATLPLRNVRAVHAPKGGRDIIVAVDAGHGGDDPGATGVSGTHEKDVTLAIARALAARIDREPGMHAVLTRDGDYFVGLRDRMARAQAVNANMFVSIHADAVRDREVSGASVYILSERGASSEAAKRLAEQENAADMKGGISLADVRPDLRSVVVEVVQNANIGQSVEAADRVLGALDRVGAVRKREVQQAAFVVLKAPAMPSLLIETAYISNASEERRLRTPAQQQRLAEAIFGGIDSYFRKFPPDGSQYAHTHGDGADNGPELARSGF